MRNIITSLMLLLLPVVAGAVTVPAGTYHFDNSLTAYTTVKFVYGNDSENKTTIVELTKGDGNLWTFVCHFHVDVRVGVVVVHFHEPSSRHVFGGLVVLFDDIHAVGVHGFAGLFESFFPFLLCLFELVG